MTAQLKLLREACEEVGVRNPTSPEDFDRLPPSESLYSMASIVTGNGARLGEAGMLAQPRHTEQGIDMNTGETIDIVVDPEARRTPTAGHDHANDPGRVIP